MNKSYLNEQEVAKLIAFKEDTVMFEAVRKVLFEGITEVGVFKEGVPFDHKNWAYSLGGLNDMVMDDEKVGKLLKITSKAFAILEDAYSRLKEFNAPETEKEEETNPAV